MVFTRIKILLGILILCGISITMTVSAQTSSSDTVPDDLSGSGVQYDTGPTENDISIDFSPENPGALQNVVLRTSSDYIDLNRYHASWYVNGKKIADGIGVRTATIKTGPYGQKTSVIILIQLQDTLIKKTLSFEPQDMTLLWEAVDTYTPPFYQGKKLASRESIIKTVAIPNFKTRGSSFNPSSGVYNWSRNGNVVAGATGYGKEAYLFKNNKIRSTEEITVTASDTDSSHQATQTIIIPTYNPKILFYQKNIQTGLTYPFAKTNLDLVQDSATIIAEPFFFSTTQGNPNSLVFNWTMNTAPITLSDTTNQQTVTLQNPGGSGKAQLGLSMTNANSLFQTAESLLPIVFNKN